MKIRDFKLERYFAKYEFHTRHLLSSSDCDGLSLSSLLDMAGDEERRLWNDLKLGYTESQGLPTLRQAIADQYTSIDPDHVLVLSPGEANFCLMNVLLEKNDHVVCMSPAYQSLYQVAESIGCKVDFWRPDPATWQFSTETLRSLIQPETKLLIINFPHNPTGFIPTVKELNEIAEIASTHRLTIFSDEMYHHLVHDPSMRIASMSDLYDRAVSLWGMAKSFGLAGLRLGWLVSRNKKVIDDVMSYKDYLTICNNSMSEVLSLIAIRNSEKLIDSNLQKIRSNIGAFTAFKDRHPDLISFPKPKAGSTLFAKLNIGEPALAYCERLVQQAGIMLLPSEMFDFGDQHVRIGLGREKLQEGINAWDDFIARSRR
ncbi:MAG: aminotransferase class I/II-fold pyridoxal phosphate-dependent enzyme [Cyclobacteriaceae bacterium]|nr:aminotransferase class I/II-fold pyridoxal phosphate-dependent enzyme [Cyclobacteriaceae bacterium]